MKREWCYFRVRVSNLKIGNIQWTKRLQHVLFRTKESCERWVNSSWRVNLTFRLMITYSNGNIVSSTYCSIEGHLLRLQEVHFAHCRVQFSGRWLVSLSQHIWRMGRFSSFLVLCELTCLEMSSLWVIRIHWFFVIALLPVAFFVPETHGPTILTNRAKRLRAAGKISSYAANELQSISTKQLFKKHIGRPLGTLCWLGQ